MDPTGHDAFSRWLAYGHPAWMVVAIGTALVTLRAGLALRRARLGRRPRAPDARARHARLGRIAVALLLVGFLGGPLSMGLLRGRAPFATVHAFVGTLAAGLFVAVALLGRRLEQGRVRRRTVDVHAALALLATLGAAIAFATGFVLLP